jgi:hypothetical protein
MPAGHENQQKDLRLRFFAAEQVDEILRQGAKSGALGSRAAIRRILKVEPEVERVQLWRRIRELKHPRHERVASPAIWTAADDAVLREGYAKGWSWKRRAIAELLRRHPEWRPHVIWRRAATLGLVERGVRKQCDRQREKWSDADDQILLGLAGYKSVETIAKAVHRSVNAVRSRLIELGKSTRFQKEGYARETIARDLHLGSETIRRMIANGLLEVRDPRITKESLNRFRRILSAHASSQDSEGGDVSPSAVDSAIGLVADKVSDEPHFFRKGARALRVWEEVALELGVTLGRVRQSLKNGVLKVYDARITEASLRNLCQQYGWIIDEALLNSDTRYWLQSSMDFVRQNDAPFARKLEGRRKHARIERTCPKCRRKIRGNSYFRHAPACARKNAVSGAKPRAFQHDPRPPFANGRP